jgi:hypothetical protein
MVHRTKAATLGAPATAGIGRRATIFAAGLGVLGGATWFLTSTAGATLPAVTVWKSATCECCGGWVRHMRAAGFPVSVRDLDDVQPVKSANGVPEALRSCHTALVDGYVVEGHVPATDIQRLLDERPAARGLAAPGMPRSAPGMDGPPEPYDIVLFGGPTGDMRYVRH